MENIIKDSLAFNWQEVTTTETPYGVRSYLCRLQNGYTGVVEVSHEHGFAHYRWRVNDKVNEKVVRRGMLTRENVSSKEAVMALVEQTLCEIIANKVKSRCTTPFTDTSLVPLNSPALISTSISILWT